VNLSNEEYTINPQERIAQLVLQKVYRAEFEIVETLEESKRDSGGFGHTGK
jgi:dUTP pyrophosphatase